MCEHAKNSFQLCQCDKFSMCVHVVEPLMKRIPTCSLYGNINAMFTGLRWDGLIQLSDADHPCLGWFTYPS